MADASLVFNIIGRDRLGDTLAKAKAEALAASGDSTKGFERLDAQIRETETSIKRLTERFVETGDTDILRDLRKEHKTLDGLRKVRHELGTLVRGAEAAGSFMSLFGQQLSKGASALGETIGSSIKAHPYIAAGVAAAIVIGAPMIGAALNAVLLAAVGGGTLAAGIAFALQDSRVNAAWSSFGTTAIRVLQSASGPLTGPLIHAAGIIKAAFVESIGGIKSGFTSVVPLVERFAHGIADMFRQIGPGFSRALSASLPILRDLADWLPELGDAVGDMFDQIARGSGGARMFFSDFLSWLSFTIREIGLVIHFLSDCYTVLRAIGQVMTGDVTGAVQTLAHGFAEVKDRTKDTIGPMSDFRSEGEKAADAMKKMNEAAGDLVGSILGLRDADIAFHEALRAITQAAKDNGVSLDINSEAGLKNQSVINDGIKKAWAHREAILARTNSIEEADKAFDGEMKSLYDTAAAAGFNKEAVRRMVEEIRSVPRDTPANIELRNAGKTQDDIREINRALNTIDTYIPVVVEVYKKGDLSGIGGTGFKGYAAGGTPPVGQPFWVGEHGPELMFASRPSYVMNAAESSALARGATRAGGTALAARSGGFGGGGAYTVNVYTQPGASGAQIGSEVVEAIKAYEKRNGTGWRS